MKLGLYAVVLAVAMTSAASAEQARPKEKGKPPATNEQAPGMTVAAQKPGKGKGTVVFNDTQRGDVRSYFLKTYGQGNCPPGLAKKNNGCLPPGQAKKRYTVGQRLPSGIVILDLPSPLSARMGPAPAGYRYGLLDGDLLKLAVGTLLVVDAIQGFVH
jgi:hypothetical protein